jgi:hypothetical protein
MAVMEMIETAIHQIGSFQAENDEKGLAFFV